MVEANVVTNNVVWDGNTQTWTPPSDATMLVQATTLALVWESVNVDGKTVDWILAEQIGAGEIGFTWNGSVLTTNKPKPAILTTTQGTA